MKTIASKLITIFSILFLFQFTHAQQGVCYGETKNYKVDDTENSGNGTTGSTYNWTVTGTGYAGTKTNLTTSGNNININWGTTPVGTYTVSVVETSSSGCVGLPKTLTVTILSLPIVPTISTNTPICSNENAVFTLTGTPNLTVNYTLNGVAGTTTIGAGGTVQIPVNNATASQTLTITSITNGTCPVNNITGASATILVNPAPTTSNITY